MTFESHNSGDSDDPVNGLWGDDGGGDYWSQLQESHAFASLNLHVFRRVLRAQTK